MLQTILEFMTYCSGLLTWMPAVHLALGLLALTTTTLGGGILAVFCFRHNPGWRSLAARVTIALTALVIAVDLLAQATWSYSEDAAIRSRVAVATSAPFARPIAQLVHPGERLVSDDTIAALGHSLANSASQNGSKNASASSQGAEYHAIESTWPFQFERDFAIVWIVVILIMLLRRMIGQIAVARVAKSSLDVEQSHGLVLFQQLLVAYHLPQSGWRRARLRSSNRIDAPFVSGFLAYTLFLPESATSEADESIDDLRAMLAHELAHARRFDPLFSLLSQAVCAACWFQPLTWIMARLVEASAESAADAETVAVGGCDAPEYAQLLHRIASGRVRRLTESVAGVGMMPRRSQLAKRIEQIVKGGIDAVSLRISPAQRIGLFVCGGLLVALATTACLIRYVPSPADAAAMGKIILAPAWSADNAALNGYTVARENGWSVGPVLAPRDGTLFNASSGSFGTPITAREQGFVASLNKLQYPNTTGNGWRPALGDRRAVERILAQSPHFFYAEEMMAMWYDKDNQPGEARQWRQQALKDAPQIFSGRVMIERDQPGGRSLVPAAGFSFHAEVATRSSWSAGTRVQDATYGEIVTTDQTGRFYIPAFGGITTFYTATSWAPGGHSVTDALMARNSMEQARQDDSNGFVSETHVGVVAPFVLTPYIKISLDGKRQPITDSGIGSFEHPAKLLGSRAAVTWTGRSDATAYRVTVWEQIKQGSGYSWNPISPANNLTSHTAAALNFSAGDLGLLSGRVYQLCVEAVSTNGMPNHGATIDIAASQPFYFTVPDQPVKLPLTTDLLAAALAGRVENVQIARRSGAATITLEGDSFQDYNQYFQRNLFGYTSSRINSRQLTLPSYTPGAAYSPGRSLYKINLSDAPATT